MGLLFSSNDPYHVNEIGIDFETAQPGSSDASICKSIESLLSQAPGILEAIDSYKDCSAQIRQALSSPNPESEQTAFNAVKSNVALISKFFEFSKQLASLCKDTLILLGDSNVKQSFQANQAAVKKLAEMLDFVLRFDEMKMLRPGIQNDFSYYRRVLGKHLSDPDIIVRDEEASFISLFIAQPIPMMTSLAKQGSIALKEASQVMQVLATMANVCHYTLKTGKFKNVETDILLVRAMIGSIVLFDHISLEGGAFVKRSGINIKECVKLVVKQYSTHQPLINMLKYSTVHYQDESTPSAITKLLSKA